MLQNLLTRITLNIILATIFMFICLLIHFTGSHFRIDDQELSDVIATVERDLFAAVQHHKRP